MKQAKRLILILLGFNVIIFSQIFPSFLFADDFLQYYDQRFTDLPGLAGGIVASSLSWLFRPVHYMVLALYYKLFYVNIFYCYLVMFMSHLLAALSVYYFLLRLKRGPLFASIGSILFLTYCGSWEVVGWTAVVYYPLLVIFLLNAISYYIDRRGILSSVFFFLALMTHEAAILFVPLVAAYEA
jgi:hypothetical protein